MSARRWDDDERGHGVADGRRVEADAGELLEALREPEWVAEDGDDHLLPHLRHACERGAVPLRLGGAATEADGAFAVELTWLGRPEDVRAVRSAVYALIGEVATGMLGPDTRHTPHGHVLVPRVNGAFGGA
jgi:hypothetical protein